MVLTLDQEPRQRRRWGQLVARAWDDDDFRQLLFAEPEAVLREEGFDVPDDVEFRVLEGDESEDAGDAVYLRFPAKPGAEALFEDDLTLSDMLYARHSHKTSGGGCKKSL